MAQIRVRAKVSGLHAVSGMQLTEGEELEIDERHFGDQIMERISAVDETDKTARSKAAADKKEG